MTEPASQERTADQVATRRDLALVVARLHRLERLYVAALCVVVVGLLVAGSALPLFTVRWDSGHEPTSVLSALGEGLGDSGPASDDDPAALGHLLVLVVLCTLLVPVLRAMTGRTLRSLDVWALIVVVPTAVISTTVLALTARAGAESLAQPVTHGPGGVLLVAGSAAAGLLLTPPLRAIVTAERTARATADLRPR